MPYTPNATFKAATPIGSAMQNLVSAFFTQPTAKDRAAVDYYDARTQKALSDAQLNAQKMRAPRTIAQSMRAAYAPQPEAPRPDPEFEGPMPAVPRETMVRNQLPNIASSLSAMGKPGDIGDLFLTLMANAPGSSDDASARAFVGSGKAIGENDAFSLGGRDAVAERNTLNDIREQQAEPINTSAGGITTLAPGDPRGDGTIYGPATESTMSGDILRAIMAGEEVDPRAVAAVGGDGSSRTPRNYRTPEGTVGTTLDGVTDAATGQRLPGGTTVSTSQLDTELTNATESDLQAADIQQRRFVSLVDQVRSVARDPANFGFPGFVKGTLQDLTALADGVADSMGYSGFQSAVTDARSSLMRSPDVSAETVSSFFDPDLPALQSLANLLAYQAAATLAGQEGRSVSDRDVKMFQNIVGDPQSFFTSQEKFLSKLSTLEETLMGQRQADRDFQTGAPLRGEGSNQEDLSGSISGMGRDQLMQLDPATLSPGERRAAADRWEALKASE